MFKKLTISIANCHSNRGTLNLLQKGQPEGGNSPSRAVEIPELLKVNHQEQVSTFLAFVCLKQSLSCFIPIESTFLKLVTVVRKSLMERVVLDLRLFWVFSSFAKSTIPQDALDSPCWGWRKSWLHIREPHHHQNTSVSPYLCPGFRLRLCAWLHCALLLQRGKGKKCHSKQKLLQLQAEVLVPTAGAEFLQSFPIWSQLVFPNIPQLCWLGCASET